MWQREIFVKREIVEDNEERFFDKIFLTREKIFCHGMEGWRAHGLIHVVGSEEDWSPTQVGKVFDDGEPLLTCIINIRDQTCGPEIFSRPKIGLTFKNKRFRTIVKWDSHKSGWEPLWDWTQTKVNENHCKWALKKFENHCSKPLSAYLNGKREDEEVQILSRKFSKKRVNS